MAVQLLRIFGIPVCIKAQSFKLPVQFANIYSIQFFLSIQLNDDNFFSSA